MDLEDYVTSATVFWPARAWGSVPPVGDQRDTNACVPFALANVIYSDMYISGHRPYVPSRQQMYDATCGIDENNERTYDIGFEDVIDYIMGNGVFTEDQYPWTGEDGRLYIPNVNMYSKIHTLGYEVVLRHNITPQLDIRPSLAAGIYNTPSFEDWDGVGIYSYTNEEFNHILAGYDPKRESDVVINYVGHAVTIVGYGYEDFKDYLIIQDSFGVDNYCEGFFKMDLHNFLGAYYTTGSHHVVSPRESGL